MAIINFTGFEQGPGLTSNGGDDYQPFGGSGGSVQSTVKKHGTYAAEFVKTTTGSCYLSVNGERSADGNINLNSGSWATLYMQGYFRYSSKPSANSEQIMEVHGTGGDAIAEIHLDLNGKIRVYDFNNYGTPVLLATGTTTLSANTWYKLSIKIVAGSSGSYEVKIDDAAELSGSRSWAITLNLRNVFLGPRRDRNGESMTVYWDDYCSSDSAYPFTSGEYAVGILKPNANGSTMSWSGGTGASDYTQVDEIPWSDSDYVQSPTSGNPNVGLFNFQSRSDASLSIGTIKAVKAIILIAENSSVTSSTKVRIRSGGSNSDSTGYNGGTSSIGLGRVLESDPSTSTAWTGSGIDAIEAGAVEDNAVAVRLYNAMVHVLYEVSTVQNYTQNLTETITLVETRLNTTSKPFTEVVALVEVLAKKPAKIFTEVITLVETQIKTTGKAIVEAITLSEVFSRLQTAFRSLTETITLVDTVDPNKIAVVALVENISLVDAYQNVSGKVLTETITLVETFTKGLTAFRAFTETITLVDTMAILRTYFQTLTETITLVETAIKSTAKSFVETIALNEVMQTAKVYARAFVEVITLVDTTNSGRTKYQVLTETITLVDSMRRVTSKILTETLSLTQRFLGMLNGKDISYRSKYENRSGEYRKKYLDF